MKTVKTILIVVLISTLGTFTGKSQTTNSKESDFKIWAQTPPMGWNSWDCYGPTVEEHEVKANADYMAKYLKEFGWKYIVVDIRWFVRRHNYWHRQR